MIPKWWFAFIAVIGVLILVGVARTPQSIASPSRATGESAPAAAAIEPPPAYSLAIIQGGDTGLLTKQFQRQLDILSSKCNESESTISDQLVTTHDILHKHGIDENYLTLLTDVDRVVPAGTSNTCAQDFAAYATIRINTP